MKKLKHKDIKRNTAIFRIYLFNRLIIYYNKAHGSFIHKFYETAQAEKYFVDLKNIENLIDLGMENTHSYFMNEIIFSISDIDRIYIERVLKIISKG